jgi:hypothetical protein
MATLCARDECHARERQLRMRHEDFQRRRTIERVVATIANHAGDFCGNRIALPQSFGRSSAASGPIGQRTADADNG